MTSLTFRPDHRRRVHLSSSSLAEAQMDRCGSQLVVVFQTTRQLLFLHGQVPSEAYYIHPLFPTYPLQCPNEHLQSFAQWSFPCPVRTSLRSYCLV